MADLVSGRKYHPKIVDVENFQRRTSANQQQSHLFIGKNGVFLSPKKPQHPE